MLKHLLLFSLFVLFSAPALGGWITSSTNIKELYFNLGTHTEFYNAVQMDDSGGLRKFDVAPTLGAGIGIPTSETFTFLPEFNWVLPQSLEEGKVIKNLFMFRADLGWDALEWLRLRFGTSFMFLNQQGKGGKALMNNGNTQTVFYYPDENRSSWNNTLDLGVETIFDQLAFRLQTYTYSIFKKDQRQISYTLFVTYYWDKIK